MPLFRLNFQCFYQKILSNLVLKTAMINKMSPKLNSIKVKQSHIRFPQETQSADYL